MNEEDSSTFKKKNYPVYKSLFTLLKMLIKLEKYKIMDGIVPNNRMVGRKSLTLGNDPLYIIKIRLQVYGNPVTISGAIVRYSKLSFRQLCHCYNTGSTYLPMILAREFLLRDKNARISDFTTKVNDLPLVA